MLRVERLLDAHVRYAVEELACTAVSLVLEGSTIRLVAGVEDGNIALFRYEPGGLDVFPGWYREEVLTDQCTAKKPSFALAPDLTNPAWIRRWILWTDCTTSNLVIGRSNTPGGPAEFAGVYPNGPEPNLGSAVALYDARPMLASRRRGLRLMQTVVITGGPTVDIGRCAAAPSPSTLVAGRGCVETSSNLTVGWRCMNPFMQGSEPGLYVDYDDWTGMQHGFCERISFHGTVFGTPSWTDDYVRVAYNEYPRCGPVPQYFEPRPPGMPIMMIAPSLDDRTHYPHFYVPRDFVCQ